VETPDAQVSASLERILGFSQPVDSLEHMNRKMANAVAEFSDAQPPPPARKGDELGVVTETAKGCRSAAVPIKRRSRPIDRRKGLSGIAKKWRPSGSSTPSSATVVAARRWPMRCSKSPRTNWMKRASVQHPNTSGCGEPRPLT
jgi:hypothetical protein